jgi:hypothetical protein
MVSFYLFIFRDHASLKLSGFSTDTVTEDFLEANAGDLERLSGQRPVPGTNKVMRLPACGWAGPTTGWALGLDNALSCVELLIPRLSPVDEHAKAFWKRWGPEGRYGEATEW